MDEQQFVLKWHLHEAALLSGLPRLLDCDLLTDITLSAGCRSIRAHRVVLATCSAYFLQLFQNMGPLQHPVIVLQDTDYNDLNAIVSFMYRGQCLVTEKQLPSVLAAAKLLQIRGLCDLKVPETKPQALNLKKDSPNLTDSTNQTYVIRDDANDVQLTTAASDKPITSLTDAEPIVYTNKPNLPEATVPQAAAEPAVEPGATEAAPWKLKGGSSASKCFICGKYLSNQYNLRVHMETHEDGYHACASCPHVSRSRDALRKHVSYRHPDESVGRKRKARLDLL